MTGFVVIGGGITGCATAWALARAGQRVTLLEGRSIAAMASGWTLGGVRQSGRDPAELPLAKAAVELWPRLSALLGRETGYARHGNLRIARNQAEAAVIRAMIDEQRSLGLDLTYLPDSKSIRALAPAVSPDVIAASYCATDGFADPVAATNAFAGAARTLGADVQEGVSVLSVALSKGRVCGVETTRGFYPSKRVIIAAGTHTPGLLAPLGLSLPLRITRVQVAQSEPLASVFSQVFGVANADCAGRQEASGRFRVTTGISPYVGDPDHWSEESLRPSPDDVAALLERVTRILPILANVRISGVWGGLIDLTPDGLPVIDAPPEVPGLVVAAGFSGHGFGIGPITGKLTAEIAMGVRPTLDIGAFRLARLLQSPSSHATLALHG